jgi:hypothetical protein
LLKFTGLSIEYFEFLIEFFELFLEVYLTDRLAGCNDNVAARVELPTLRFNFVERGGSA